MIGAIREDVKKQSLMQNEIQNANEELKNKNRLMDEFINEQHMNYELHTTNPWFVGHRSQ